MNLKNYTILELLNELNSRCYSPETGILSSSANCKVMEALRFNENMEVGLALTFGKPTNVTEKTHKCSRCGNVYPSDQFKYYLSRIDGDGFLMRTNAICSECSKLSDEKRRKSLFKEEYRGNVNAKPKEGDVCPVCDRKWYGVWHRHHNAVTDKFITWACGFCNMKFNDQRELTNPDKITV